METSDTYTQALCPIDSIVFNSYFFNNGPKELGNIDNVRMICVVRRTNRYMTEGLVLMRSRIGVSRSSELKDRRKKMTEASI